MNKRALVFQIKRDQYQRFLEEQFRADGWRPKFPLDYQLVAIVRCDDCGPNELEIAFRQTNTIDCPWWQNNDVMFVLQELGCRSTSVGDVVVLDSVIYRVENAGWLVLDEWAENPVTPPPSQPKALPG